MKLSSTFISNIQDIYGGKGTSWLNDLPAYLERLCKKRGLRFLKVMSELTYNFVCIIEIITTNEQAVLKMAPTLQNIGTEAKWLQCFNKGVPKIYWVDEKYNAFLMEYLFPGKSLKSVKDDEKATRIICQTIRDLQTTQKNFLPCKHISELSKNFSILQGHIDNKLLSQTISWFNELISDQTQEVLLHGDLHHNNILSCSEGWKVIDPHGYIGDPAFEVGAMIYNPINNFPADHSLSQVIEERLKILAEELPFDAQRIKACTFCMTMLSLAWTVEDHAYVPELQLSIAKVIANTRI